MRLDVQHLILVLYLVSCLGRVHAFDLSAGLDGEFEVLIADHFELGTTFYQVFFHTKSAGLRIPLEPSSLGDSLGQVRTGLHARLWLQSNASSPSLRRSMPSESSSNQLNKQLYQVDRWESIEEDAFSAEAHRRDAPQDWHLSSLRRLLVILTNFEDDRVLCNASDISKMIWGTTSSAFQGNVSEWNNIYRIFQVNSQNSVIFAKNSSVPSSNATHLSATDVVGPFTIPRKIKQQTTCDHEGWANDALAAAAAAHVPLSLYTQVMFILPDSSHMRNKLCHWTGLAHVGCGHLCRSWIADCRALGVFAHELGHNMGFGHSSSNWDFKGPQIEYGDPTCIMSNQWDAYPNYDYYFNAVHRATVGWMPSRAIISLSSEAPPADISIGSPNPSEQATQQRPLTTHSLKLPNTNFSSATARTFRIAPYHYATEPNIYQAIKIDRFNSTGSYWISYQTGRVTYANRALIHYRPPSHGGQSVIIQSVVPQSEYFANLSRESVTTLYRDPDLTFAARVLRVDSSSMDVQVTWKCEKYAPRVALIASPQTTLAFQLQSDHSNRANFSLALPAGSATFPFDLVIGNPNSDLCPVSLYNISQSSTQSKVKVNCARPNISIAPRLACTVSCTAELADIVNLDTFTLTIEEIAPSTEVMASPKTVHVQLVQDLCARAPPSLHLDSPSPISSLNYLPVNISFWIHNSDSLGCPPRSFQLSVTVLNATGNVTSGWRFESSPATFVSPDSDAQLSLLITPSYAVDIGVVVPLEVRLGDSNDDSSSSQQLVQFGLRVVRPCARNPPSIEMANPRVSFFARNAASATVRVTNNDDPLSECSSSSFSAALIPDPSGTIQSAIYPTMLDIPPGSYKDFIITTTTPDMKWETIEESATTTQLLFHSPSHAQVSLTQTTWTAPVLCSSHGLSMGFTCPEYFVVPPEATKVTFKCDYAWRNNDPFTCPPSTLNVTMKSHALDSQVYLNGSDRLLDYTFTYMTQELQAGETAYQPVTVVLNLTEVNSLLTSSNATVQGISIILEAIAQSAEGEPPKRASIFARPIYLGLCALRYPAETPSLELDQASAPSLTYGNFTSPNTPENASLPVVELAWGVTRTFEWTLGPNPLTPFCSRTSFELLLASESALNLTALNIAYQLHSTSLNPGESGRVGLALITPLAPAFPPSSLVNITVYASYNFNRTTYQSMAYTIMLNMTNNCSISAPGLRLLSASVEQVSPTHTTMAIGSSRHVSEQSQALTDLLRLDVPLNRDSVIYAVVRLNNDDSGGCLASTPFYSSETPDTFVLQAQNMFEGLRNLIRTSFNSTAASSRDTASLLSRSYSSSSMESTSAAFAVPPRTEMVVNVTIEIPSTILPGTYVIQLKLYSDKVPEHTVMKDVRIVVNPDPPRPVWDVRALEAKSPFGVVIGQDIVWRACERPDDCLCPCTYHILVDGTYQVSTTSLRWPYRFGTTSGQEVSIQVIAQDSLGINSTTNACGSSVSFTQMESKLDNFVVLVVIVAVMLVPVFVLLLELLRHRNCLPLSRLDFTYSDEERSVEYHEMTNMEEIELEVIEAEEPTSL